MFEWLQQQVSSHKAQLTATAALSGLVVASTIFSLQAWRRKAALDDLKASIPELSAQHHLPVTYF